ncbi:N-acetyltransferase family 8 member 3 [Astyanax mexicanus]|uniref:N-acetyltransferase family 8 member 3 n=1 Tax=Astyanax mexicanus TaxID=7994 RepID=UPI0020CAD5E0|nr:N-acetyltransferase family 8 member 3 [Astyanax mexicanus]
MVQKNNIQCSIRPYRASDRDPVISLFRFGILEHVYPAFFKAMCHKDHVGIALSISVAGYVLGGSSYCMALLFGGAWAALVYYCCHEIYDSYLSRKLDMEMADIQGSFLDNPVNNFWVAEAEIDGQIKVAGLLAVVGMKCGLMNDMNDGWNGGAVDVASLEGSAGEVFKLVVSFPLRRKGIGTQLTEKAVEFCKEQGLSRLVIETTSAQVAAIALFRKLGFIQTSSHSSTHANRWISKLARINVLRMEKFL